MLETTCSYVNLVHRKLMLALLKNSFAAPRHKWRQKNWLSEAVCFV